LVYKKIIFFFLLTTLVYSQQVEISAVAHSIVSGLTISNQMKDRSAYGSGDPIYREYQKKWRALLPLELTTGLLTGVAIAYNNNSWLGIATDIINQPNTDHTHFRGIEKWMDAYVKIGILVFALGFKYFILPLLR
jgi:hypothetical protein